MIVYTTLSQVYFIIQACDLYEIVIKSINSIKPVFNYWLQMYLWFDGNINTALIFHIYSMLLNDASDCTVDIYVARFNINCLIARVYKFKTSIFNHDKQMSKVLPKVFIPTMYIRNILRFFTFEIFQTNIKCCQRTFKHLTYNAFIPQRVG